MNELLKVSYASDRIMVSARELHRMLDVKTPFDKWFPRMCEYGFSNGEDFSTFLSESTGGRPAHDAQLTIEMAKELCMLQRTERGKQARQYFIQLEKDWNSPEKVMARALLIEEVDYTTVPVLVEVDNNGRFLWCVPKGTEHSLQPRENGSLKKWILQAYPQIRL